MAVSVRVSEIGADAAAGKLDRVGLSAHAQAPTMAVAGARTARGIRGIPVDSGRLAASPTVLTSGAYGFVVGSEVPYARFVFRGTRKMAARPPRIPSHVGADTAAAISNRIVGA